MKSFEYRHFIAASCEVTGTGKTGRTGTDDGDFVPVSHGFIDWGDTVLHMVISDEALQTADRNGLAFDGSDTLRLTLILLWANATANSGQTVCTEDYLIRRFEISINNFLNKFRNANIDRTSVDAWLVFAIQATLRFFLSHLGGVTQSHLCEIGISNIRILLRHRDF